MDSIDEDSIYIRDSLDEIIKTLKERLNRKYSLKLKKSIEYLESTKKVVIKRPDKN